MALEKVIFTKDSCLPAGILGEQLTQRTDGRPPIELVAICLSLSVNFVSPSGSRVITTLFNFNDL